MPVTAKGLAWDFHTKNVVLGGDWNPGWGGWIQPSSPPKPPRDFGPGRILLRMRATTLLEPKHSFNGGSEPEKDVCIHF